MEIRLCGGGRPWFHRQVSRIIHVLTGCTAVGKTELALRWAAARSAEIVSCDSLLFYRGADIGTAKPSPAEQAEVKHHLIDVVTPAEEFTVARFVELADAAIADTRKRGVALIATGGTPLYYKALFEGLFDGPAADQVLRERLRSEPAAALHARLAQVDPAAAARIHVNDSKRLVRAVEVYELTGRPISSYQTEWIEAHARHDAIWFGLLCERDALNRRIHARVKAMIQGGWVEETRRLLERYGQLSRTAAEATGYAELIGHVRARLSLEEAVEEIKIATRQLARRQMKWLRRFPRVQWLAGELPLEEKIDRVLHTITSHGPPV